MLVHKNESLVIKSFCYQVVRRSRGEVRVQRTVRGQPVLARMPHPRVHDVPSIQGVHAGHRETGEHFRMNAGAMERFLRIHREYTCVHTMSDVRYRTAESVERNAERARLFEPFYVEHFDGFELVRFCSHPFTAESCRYLVLN